jgi:hypothetical protein
VCSAFVHNRVFERVRANMHEASRKRVCGLMQEFRKHERGVLSATSGRGPWLQKIVEHSYGLRGQRKWAFHRAYNLSMHHNTVTGPPWPAAEYDERFGWKTEVDGQLMLMQTAAPLPLPLLRHLHEMMATRPRAERRMYEAIAHVPRTPLVPQAPSPGGGEAALHELSDESLGISVAATDFSMVEVKQNRRSKVRFKRKTKIDRKFLTNGDLASVCKSFGRASVDDHDSAAQASTTAERCRGSKISVRAQLKDALEQLRKSREELQRLQPAVPSAALPPRSVAPVDALKARAGLQAAGCGGSAIVNNSRTMGVKSGRVQYAALPHPLAVIPGTKEAAAVRAAHSAVASSNLKCSAAAPCDVILDSSINLPAVHTAELGEQLKENGQRNAS